MENESQDRYESPDVTDFGTIEEVTKGVVDPSLDDVPFGRDHVSPAPAPTPSPGGSSIIA